MTGSDRPHPRVLHVMASGARRGGEVFASDLIRTLHDHNVHQDVAVLHGPPPDTLGLPVPARILRMDTDAASAKSFDLKLLSDLRSAVREARADVVQAHGGEALKYLALASFKPIIYRRIGAVVDPLRHGIRRMAFTTQMRRAARVIAVAEAVRRETIDAFGLNPSKVVMIPNGVDAARFQPTTDRATFMRSLGLPQSVVIMTFLGAFTWEKDPLTSLHVAARVLEAVPHCVFLVAGDGPLRSEMEAARAESVHRERILLLGSRTDVGNILAATDLLLSTSATEGMPANVIEAGITGVPVVAYGLSGIPEVVIDGVTGAIVIPGDTRSLESAVIALLSNHDRRRAMGAAARQRCLAKFDINNIAPLYLSLYREVHQDHR